MIKGKMIEKMHKARAAVLAVLAGCVLSVLSGGVSKAPVIAAAQTAVTLTSEGNQAEVSLDLPLGNQSEQQGYGGIKALQLGFQVNILHGEGEEYQVSFLFDAGITSSVKQFSYQEETGLLQIYLSGEGNLYEGGSITLGKIVVESNGFDDVTASIRVAEGSLKTVNDAFDLQEQPFSAPEMVQVTAGGHQAGKDGRADGESAGNGTDNQKAGTGEVSKTETEAREDGTDPSGSSAAAGQSGSSEKPAGITEPAAGGSETPGQEPLLRLVETEKRNGFSLKHFSFQSLLADEKARIVLGIVAVAAVALILGTIVRAVHNRKKKKKTWW